MSYSHKDVHILIPEAVKVTLCSKRGFADVIRDLEMGRLAWIIHMGPIYSKKSCKQAAGDTESVDVTMED